MSTVKDVLDQKGRTVFSIEADKSVLEAIEVMVAKDVAALVVIDEGTAVAGIITERDYARKVLLSDKSPKDIIVRDIMTRDVMYVREETLIDTCMDIMSQKNFHHLPVVDRNKAVAVVTAGDLFKYVVQKQSMAIDELEDYIFEEAGGEG
jgi:CBS domain-containing protein